MVSREVRLFDDDFCRAQVLSATPGVNGWTVKDNSSAGAPTYLCVSGQGLVLTLAATSEAEVVTAYFNDVLPYDVLNLQHVNIVAKVSGIDAATTVVLGVASTQSDTSDSVPVHAWFKISGPTSVSAVVCETDDGTNDVDDQSTGQSLAAVFKKFEISFANGVGDIRFAVNGQPVDKPRGTFKLSAITDVGSSFVQPFIQIQKASGTGVPSITIRRFQVQHTLAMGSAA